MGRGTPVLIAFFGAFVLAIGVIAATDLATRAAESQQIYWLDPTYHKLPPELVAELRAHPPKRSWLGPRVRCEVLPRRVDQPVWEPAVGYCICFGAEACAAAPCTGPLGAVDDHGTLVCRGSARITVTGG